MYTVIIADDEQLICSSIASVIRTCAPELRVTKIFHNGTDAYEYLRANRADILLLDIEMPGSSGLDLAQFVDEQNTGSYVIMITAYHNFDYAKRAIDCHVDAFLTKPFSSQQLVKEIRKAIASFDQRSASDTDSRKMQRSLLQSLCSGSHTVPVYHDFRLCRNTACISDLKCTSVNIKDDGLCTLSSADKEAMLQLLARTVEEDTLERTSFFLKNTEETVELLIFSREEPRSVPAQEALQIIHSYTKGVPCSSVKTYPSFSDYRVYLTFSREMSLFFKLLASAGSKQAKAQLAKFLHTLTPTECDLFARFLSGEYQLATAGTEPDLLLQSLDTLIGQTLGTHSGNYIVDSAKKYISEHYSSTSLSLDAVADTLSISSVYLSRIFKKHTGQNFSEYLLNYRMEQALELLRCTYMPTTEVASAVGYGNPAYFRSSFKLHFGMTPRQYRQIQLGKEGTGQ